MSLLASAFTIGLIFSVLALGVLISYRIFKIPDITTDGSITLGASITAVLCMLEVHPLLATAAGTVAGALAGMITGLVHTKFRVNALLSGILVMTALYSVNLRVLGRSNVPLMREYTLATIGESIGIRLFGEEGFLFFGWRVASAEFALLLGALLITLAVAFVLLFFFRSHLGTAMRATGDNPQMMRALGGNVELQIVLGLMLANGLIALSGSLLAQYQGFADVQMGIGMIVWGLASVFIGEAITGEKRLGMMLAGAIIGSILFRLLVALALRWGLNPNDLKLITAVFVFIALVSPAWMNKLRKRFQTASEPVA